MSIHRILCMQLKDKFHCQSENKTSIFDKRTDWCTPTYSWGRKFHNSPCDELPDSNLFLKMEVAQQSVPFIWDLTTHKPWLVASRNATHSTLRAFAQRAKGTLMYENHWNLSSRSWCADISKVKRQISWAEIWCSTSGRAMRRRTQPPTNCLHSSSLRSRSGTLRRGTSLFVSSASSKHKRFWIRCASLKAKTLRIYQIRSKEQQNSSRQSKIPFINIIPHENMWMLDNDTYPLKEHLKNMGFTFDLINACLTDATRNNQGFLGTMGLELQCLRGNNRHWGIVKINHLGVHPHPRPHPHTIELRLRIHTLAQNHGWRKRAHVV